jgi:ankyrin repeat protein
MRRIESQANIDTEIAKLVLAWIICATRPLSPLELQHALAVEFGESTFDEWSLFEIEYIVSVCAGMVTVDEERNVIRLQHYTMQEFFLKTWTEYFPDAHGTLASTCISYLRHEAFRVELAASPNQYDESLKRFSLYEYSAKHWGYHARQSYSKVKELVQDFVQNEHALAHSLQVLFNRYVWRNKQGYSMTVSPLHPAAYFGLDECVLHFLVTGVPCDTKDEDNQTALHWAARNGQVETAELLLRQGLDINCADKEGKTALHYAAIQDNSSLIKLLVEYKADIEYTDIEGQTPLLAAVQSMKLGSVQKLIGLGASIKAVDSMRHSALHLSTTAGSRSIQITKFLLASGAFSEICDVENMIPMHYAIREGSEETVEALIQAGACVNAGIQRKHWIGMKEAGRLVYKVSPEIQKATETNHDGLTPLHWAALIGYPAMIKYLISKGADPNKRCQDGDTPLHLAIREDITPDYGDAWNSPSWRIEVLCELVEAGSEEADDAHRSVSKIRSAVIEILLSHPRLDVDLQNEQLQTPLHLVACSMDDSMVSFSRLMSKKPDISIRNYKGQTPLHLASGAGKAGMVEDLLAARASVDVLDSEGLSPLQYSVRSGKSSAAVVKLLLKCYGMIQLNPCTRKDGAGRNLLHQYLQTDAPSKEVILTMLDHGANVNEIDTEGNSPLSLCLRTSNLILNRASTCRVLLENGASVLWSDESGRNLAHISMLAYPWKPVDEVLSTLNELGVDIAAKDSNNRGILHHGAMNGSISQGIIDLLRESGSLSLQDQDNDGRTPLSYAEAMLHKDRGFSRSRRKLTLDVLVKANGD